MKRNALVCTNIIVCIIITCGFVATSIIGYRSNTDIFERDAEHVSSLAADGIYDQIDKLLSGPLNVSLAMANDNLLKSLLADEGLHLEDEDYILKLGNYLDAYREKYAYDSVFLVSTKTSRYYHFKGLDRVLTPTEPEDAWYYAFIANDEEYELNIDNDQARDNCITAFVNCKIIDRNGSLLGIIGVGLKVESLQALLREYDTRFGVEAYLVDDQGIIQLAFDKTGYERISILDNVTLRSNQNVLLNRQPKQQSVWYLGNDTKIYLVSQYVESLKWHLIVENDMTALTEALNHQMRHGVAIIVLIILFVLCIITYVLRQYNDRILRLGVSQQMEYQRLLSQTTAELYENIFEIDITHNRAGGEGTQSYFELMGLSFITPYDEAVRAIASQQILPDYAQNYLDIFLPERVLEAYAGGINNLSCDVPIRDDDGSHWIRITGRIFYWPSDESVRMISYHKNIDAERTRELLLLEKSRRDSLTGLLNKGATADAISAILRDSSPTTRHVLLMFDLDNFKNINDQYGHAVGDAVLSTFSAELQSLFRDSDILGRIGGDEFVALMPNFDDMSALSEKLNSFCTTMLQKRFGTEHDAPIPCSVGAAFYPQHGSSYSELYQKADQALYYAKAHGKGTFHLLGLDDCNGVFCRIDARDVKNLLDNATDGVSKFAATTPLTLLYFNQKIADLIGISNLHFATPGFDPLLVIAPDDRPVAQAALHQALNDGTQSLTLTLRLQHLDGHLVPVRLFCLRSSELYSDRYPIFHIVYTDLSGLTPHNA